MRKSKTAQPKAKAKASTRSSLKKLEAQMLEAFGYLANNEYGANLVGSGQGLSAWGMDGSFSIPNRTSLHDFDSVESSSLPRQEAQRRADIMYRSYSAARNVVNQKINHVVGDDFVVHFKGDLQATFDQVWKQFKVRTLLRGIVRRTEVFGEVFLLKIRETGRVRFVSSSLVKSPSGKGEDDNVFDGIELEDDTDPSSISGFYIDGERYSANEVFYFKDFSCDEESVRGYPSLVGGVRYLDMYEKFLYARSLLNWFRSAILLIRKHKGKTPTQVKSFADRVKSGTILNPAENRMTNAKAQMPGTVLDTTEDIDYEFIAPNTGAGEAEVDGRQIRLAAATYFGLPEYLFTMDSSNANYASTQVAESPAVKALRAVQLQYGDEFDRLFTWLDKRLADPSISFPSLVSRDPLKATQVRQIEMQAGVLSQETWLEEVGRDPKREMERIASGTIDSGAAVP